MGDILGKVLAIIGACFALIVAIMIVAQKQDTVKQDYINNTVVEFVDNARAAGKITPQAYEKLCSGVDHAHMLCEINIIHSSAYTVPTDVIDPNTGYYETATYRYDYTKSEILSVMYPDAGDNQEYQMKNGDYIKVEVKNITPTLGTKIMHFFFIGAADTTLFTSYGGYVGNNMQ